MAPAGLVNHNVRPLRLDRDSNEDDALSADEVALDATSNGEDDQLTDAKLDSDEDGEEHDPIDKEAVAHKFSNVSFGTLKQAHEALSRKRKRGSDEHPAQDDKLVALRARLQQIKEEKASTSRVPTSQSANQRLKTAASTSARNEERFEAEADSDSDSTASSTSALLNHNGPNYSHPARTSKHAPTALSSRHQVTRKRAVIDVPRRTARDPRFDAFHQPQQHTHTEAAYAFLREYQQSEIEELKTALKRSADNEEDKATLRRKIVSMENRIKTREAKERQQEVLRRHRKEEREKVQAGKQPYYLKEKELKERALVEKFKGMKAKEREKLVERRRLKESQREKKRTPRDRRVPAAG